MVASDTFRRRLGDACWLHRRRARRLKWPKLNASLECCGLCCCFFSTFSEDAKAIFIRSRHGYEMQPSEPTGRDNFGKLLYSAISPYYFALCDLAGL